MTHTPTYMYTLWIMPWAHGAQYRIHLHTYCIPYCTVLYCDAYLYFTAIKLYRIPMLLSHCAVHLYCVAHVVIRTVLYRTVYYTVLHCWEDMPCMTVIRKCDVGLGGCRVGVDVRARRARTIASRQRERLLGAPIHVRSSTCPLNETRRDHMLS